MSDTLSSRDQWENTYLITGRQYPAYWTGTSVHEEDLNLLTRQLQPIYRVSQGSPIRQLDVKGDPRGNISIIAAQSGKKLHMDNHVNPSQGLKKLK